MFGGTAQHRENHGQMSCASLTSISSEQVSLATWAVSLRKPGWALEIAYGRHRVPQSLWLLLLIYSFHKYLQSTYYMPEAVLKDN